MLGVRREVVGEERVVRKECGLRRGGADGSRALLRGAFISIVARPFCLILNTISLVLSASSSQFAPLNFS